MAEAAVERTLVEWLRFEKSAIYTISFSTSTAASPPATGTTMQVGAYGWGL